MYCMVMQVRYYDECKWQDVGDGLIYQFVDADGKPLAEIALKDADAHLWKWQVMLPSRYRLDASVSGGIVVTDASARKVCELILLCTIVTR